jgi:hypothetical protein
VSDIAPLGALVSLQNLDMNECNAVSDLAPLAALLSLQKLVMSEGGKDKVEPLQNRVDRGKLRIFYVDVDGRTASGCWPL